ncbi:hypothetical protein [Paracoccus sp. PARArs4]|uniref:hypothetical protein n=1 Tax=Paracoccus sp. PARArs4 TaxID=2853442 RepID=UPI0024A7662A|nr:hypothetical protein [Paracoccus sp. PARArs4]
MTRKPDSFEDIPAMADEIAQLMASRFGGARRGERFDLSTMVRRRGGALPDRLRRKAKRLAEADILARSPRIARQLPLADLGRAHAALLAHLQPLGEIARFQGRAISLTATVVFGLLLLGAAIIWVMVGRGAL